MSARHSRTVLRGGEVLVSVVGTVGETAVVTQSLAGWNVARAIAVVRPKGVSPQWIRLALQTGPVQNALNGVLNTTVQATLNLADLKRLRIPMPPEPTRKAIVEMVGALDDKIAANDRVMELSDEWVRARFSELEGASVPIGDLAINVREQVDPSSIDKQTPYVGLEHVPRRRMWLSEADTAAKISSTKAAFRMGDILFGKLRPYFHKVVNASFDGITSTDILVLRAKDARLAGLLLAAAASDQAISATSAASEGTRMPRTKWADLAGVEIPWPGDVAALAFSAEVVAIARQAGALVAESGALAGTREELLPLLMSGRVRVKDGEHVLQGVV